MYTSKPFDVKRLNVIIQNNIINVFGMFDVLYGSMLVYVLSAYNIILAVYLYKIKIKKIHLYLILCLMYTVYITV